MTWPIDLTTYKLLTDWGSLIGGFFALIAGVIAYLGARQAAAKQISAMTVRDRLQAQGIAVAIYPELLKLPVMIRKIRKRLNEIVAQFAGKQPGQTIAANIQRAGTIPMPTMLGRNIDLLFMLSEVAGPACLQLVNSLLQYDTLIHDIMSRMTTLNANEWADSIQRLQEHLTLLEGVIAKCERDVRPIHDAISG